MNTNTADWTVLGVIIFLGWCLYLSNTELGFKSLAPRNESL